MFVAIVEEKGKNAFCAIAQNVFFLLAPKCSSANENECSCHAHFGVYVCHALLLLSMHSDFPCFTVHIDKIKKSKVNKRNIRQYIDGRPVTNTDSKIRTTLHVLFILCFAFVMLCCLFQCTVDF